MAKNDNDNKTKMTAPAPTATPTPQSPGSELKNASNIPQVESGDAGIPVAATSTATRPPLSEFKKRYKKTDDGETYAVAVVPDAPMGLTHYALNSLHFWNGSAAQFKDQFEVDENDKIVQVGAADPGDTSDKKK